MPLASACQEEVRELVADESSQTATLYRNGSIARDLRIHFGSFDVRGEAKDFNFNNCKMTARLLNANLAAQWSAQGLPEVGFWCEEGPYRENGSTPVNFEAEYPTGAQDKAAP